MQQAPTFDARRSAAPAIRFSFSEWRVWLFAFAIGAAAVAAMLAAALTASYAQHRAEESERLASVTELRTEQVGHWLADGIAKVRFGAEGQIGEATARLLEEGGAPGEEFHALMTRFVRAGVASGVLVIDPAGHVIASTGNDPEVGPELVSAVSRALATAQVQITEPVADADAAHRHMDFVAALPATGSPARAVLVMRLDPDQFLTSTLGHWPLPGRTSVSTLVRRDGTSILRAEDPALRLPLADVSVLRAPHPVQVRGDAGQEVLAVARPVAGTDWLVLGRIDVAEAMEESEDDAVWIIGAGAMLLLLWTTGLYMLRQRQVLLVKDADAKTQAEKLKGLLLMQSIADSSGDSIYAKDCEGRYMLFNREACRRSGKSAEEVIGEDTFSIFPAEQAEIMTAGDRRVIGTGETYTYELDADTPSGKVTYLSTKGPLLGPDGKVTGVYGISRDISARLRTETALRESVELTRAVGNSILDHLAVLGATGKVLDCNEAWCAYAAISEGVHCDRIPRSGVGMDYLEELRNSGTPEGECALAGIQSVLAGTRTHFTFEFQCECEHGCPPRWFAMKVTPLKTAKGGAVVVYSEISELKRATAELSRFRDNLEGVVEERTAQLEAVNAAVVESERFVRMLTDNVPAAMAYWGADNRCRFANRLYRERFGWGDEIIGMDLREVLGDRTYENILPYVEGVMRGEPQHYARSIHANEGEKHYWVTCLPDRVGEEVRGFFVFSTEVTALKKAQVELQQLNGDLVIARDRAEAANRAKSAFLANMSHEIRTPMNAIIGFTELLRADCTDPEQLQRMGSVAQAADHLLQVINDILDLSKIESGKLRLERTDFSLSEAISRSMMLVEQSARTKGIELAIDMTKLPDALCGDPTRLSQAITNLMVNAVKFTEAGRIGLTGSVLEDTSNGLLLRFEVQDTGIGIAQDKIPNLFTAFEQADSSTTRRFGGTGLGLALTRHIAQLMGGDTGVQSELGAGSTFWFTARFARSCQAAASRRVSVPATPAAQEHARGRVLLVEDNRFNQEVALAVLKRGGFSADLAADGQQAIDMAKACQYDLVLMDLQMPVMDGLDATRALRRMPAYHTTPILALTANAFGETRLACLEAGMDDHIAKPITPQRLQEVLTFWMPHAADPSMVAAAPSGVALAARLGGIDGFDAGAASSAGDDAAFLPLLRQFIANYEDGMPLLDNELATGQYERARRQLDALKGASAAIGACRLQHQAVKCDAAIAQRDDRAFIRLMAFDLENELVHLVGALHDCLPELARAQSPRLLETKEAGHAQ